ncbi:MAG: hypothetical protein K2J71_03680 [Oscillospiraceae bacterium]|nr:hypothetical protein [Oscillospiraceae bacterium]
MPEPDYFKAFYASQSRICDAIDQLRKVVLKLEQDLRDLEEMILDESCDESEE